MSNVDKAMLAYRVRFFSIFFFQSFLVLRKNENNWSLPG
jgi:hypothetical protein